MHAEPSLPSPALLFPPLSSADLSPPPSSAHLCLRLHPSRLVAPLLLRLWPRELTAGRVAAATAAAIPTRSATAPTDPSRASPAIAGAPLCPLVLRVLRVLGVGSASLGSETGEGGNLAGPLPGVRLGAAAATAAGVGGGGGRGRWPGCASGRRPGSAERSTKGPLLLRLLLLLLVPLLLLLLVVELLLQARGGVREALRGRLDGLEEWRALGVLVGVVLERHLAEGLAHVERLDTEGDV